MGKTPFKRFHWTLATLYLTAFILGISILIDRSMRNVHPYFGMGVLVVPILYYLLSKKKEAIRIMLKSNFLKTSRISLRTARIATVLMMLHIPVMAVTGTILFKDLSPNLSFYRAVYYIHRSAIVILPVLVIVHATSRKLAKRSTK